MLHPSSTKYSIAHLFYEFMIDSKKHKDKDDGMDLDKELKYISILLEWYLIKLFCFVGMIFDKTIESGCIKLLACLEHLP